ncbi:hypothetical protein H257_17715 [Aphanomyces astaci]|uniref:Uncharacterized protein n=1 Tax=Aphanomyces astaci TaxID=112090 RepID=W4FFK3_APHAT|nr:hypothetical protein H257_17715 [Aphanomyces astaci]ETV65606.1 hypothetical protein H257_17715 [Aphanomyces astaci]|eukprot:XP_009844903.1 hypothetical protein H257_17715 [Aphanomyces astaci]
MEKASAGHTPPHTARSSGAGSAAPAARINHMVTPTFAAHTDQLVAQIQLLLELPSPTPPTHVDPDPNTDLVDQPGARGASIETSSAGHSLASNLECTFRGLFEALSVSAVSNQALLDRLGRTVRIEAALRFVLARLLPNGPHNMPAALWRAREEREAEMALREKVEQERGQANTERNQLEERVRGLRTELPPAAAPAARVQAAQPPEVVALLGKVRGLQTRQREAQHEAKKYKELATRVENAIQAQLSSMADQVRELDRQQRSHEEEVAKVKKAIPGRRPRLLGRVNSHFRVTSGPMFDRLLEAWVRDDPALFEVNCENLSAFAFPTRQPPSTRAPESAGCQSGCPDPSDPDLAIRSGVIPVVSRANPHDDFGHRCVVRGRRCFGLYKIGVVHDPRDYRYGIRGRGFDPHLPAAQVSTPSSKRPSPGTSTQLTKKARRSDPDAAGPLGASLPPPVDSAYASVVARSPWERYSTTLVSFVPLSWHQLPEWRELDRVLRSFWQKIAGTLFRVVQAYGVQLLRFLCYPHSYSLVTATQRFPDVVPAFLDGSIRTSA